MTKKVKKIWSCHKKAVPLYEFWHTICRTKYYEMFRIKEIHSTHASVSESAHASVKSTRRSRKILARLLVLSAWIILLPFRALADGWIPTDAGLIVALEPGDQILLSVMYNDKEYFVCDYKDKKTGAPFNYGSGTFLRLLEQDANATEPSEVSIWTIDTALVRNVETGAEGDYPLGGITYTMWSKSGRTISANSGWKIDGSLGTSGTSLCDVAFAVPTVRALTNMDPNGTLETNHTAEGRNRGTGDLSWAFDGKMGTGWNGLTYREVYMFGSPRINRPIAYTNCALVGFNLTGSQVNVRGTNYNNGKAIWQYNTNYESVPRTIFRLYIWKGHEFQTCPNTYFFAHDEQDYVKYRWGDPKTSKAAERGQLTDSTTYRKIYTTDHNHCMERVEKLEGPQSIYQTAPMNLPGGDSTYFYVGYNNQFYAVYNAEHKLGSGTAVSAFTRLDSLRVRALRNAPTAFVAEKSAYGSVAIDTTSNEPNLGATFEPIGYFFQTNSGRNVQMIPENDTTWITEEMWTITDAYMALKGRVMLYTGAEFSESDPGAAIKGWSKWQAATDIPVADKPGVPALGLSGWARIHTNRPDSNGGIEFIEAQRDRAIRYHNNGHFGSEIPDQHPALGRSEVTLQKARLIDGYKFLGWAASPDGPVVVFPADSTSKTPRVGQTLNLASPGAGLVLQGDTLLHLYAKAVYTGDINVAISFVKEDGKRYFLTHPNSSAPRFARARTFGTAEDWTNVYQGMSDAENSEPNYMSSYLIMGKTGACELCEADEYVLNPDHYTLHGGEDSLTYYEHWNPDENEYIGLYYTNPNSLLANTTWAGAFISSEGWPTPAQPCIENTRISSINYFDRDGEGVIQVHERPNSAQPEIKYNAAADQFDGVAAGSGTDFMISGVGVVDAHYVVIPDTTVEWNDTIVFDYHDHAIEKQVWSKLIGKQLLAQMKVGDDTIYFHPDRDKIYTTASQLRLSTDFRVTESFTYIRDARAESTGAVAAKDEATMTTSSNDFARTLTSGEASPVDVIYNGSPIDIEDTIRITVTQANGNRIKHYYGRWNDNAAGIKLSGDARTRNIIVRTKTYHHGPVRTRLVLKPEKEQYSLGALANQSQQLNFILIKETYRQLLDNKNQYVRDDISARDTITDALALGPGDCSLTVGTKFAVVSDATVSQHVTLKTVEDNTEGDNYDTLVISKTIKVNLVDYPVTVRVPLIQTALIDNELIWSAEDGGQRYYIMAGDGDFIYRQYLKNSSTLYQYGSNKVALIKGSANADNDDNRYITPWEYTYVAGHKDQLTLKIGLTAEDTLHFQVSGSPATPGLSSSSGSSSALTYRYAGINTNTNGNYEEKVRLKYGEGVEARWLKFTAADGLSLQEDSASATVFSWGYLLQEYYLLNNGTYPGVAQAEYSYNSATGVGIRTKYKAYREYSMLVNNQKLSLCRESEDIIANLRDPSRDWKIDFDTVLIRDCRFGCEKDSSKLYISNFNLGNLTTTIKPRTAASPLGTQYNGKYSYIVDTLQVSLKLLDRAPKYRFAGNWSSYTSIDDATVKVPLIRRTYHEQPYDSVVCVVDDDEENYTFPSGGIGETHEFVLSTIRRQGMQVLGIENGVISNNLTKVSSLTSSMALNDPALAEIRLVDEYGNIPTWCEISETTARSVTVRCKQNGVRAPRSAFLYFAYIVTEDEKTFFVNYRLTVSQPSMFNYANNQELIPSKGASGDSLVGGKQQVHENKRILYYYNPEPYDEPDQKVELPLRERGFYGWWRWYRDGEDENGKDVTNRDAPDSLWVTPPRNVGGKEDLNFPYRIIGDSVKILNPKKGQGGEPDSIKILATMGRYTVFHYPSSAYSNKNDPPAKTPFIKPPHNEKTLKYVVDISNYYDNLPLAMSPVNQADTAALDTILEIVEPTLSLREIFELRPWTEMAARLENYKYANGAAWKDQEYMEDHVVMAPTGHRLLLSTEQRYYYDSTDYKNHSESLLGYYMRDDNWDSWDWSGIADEEERAAAKKARQDTMIWCGGWDASCGWYTYNKRTGTYDTCTYTLTKDNDFLNVPTHSSLSAEQEADTVYYCLRARSMRTTGTAPDFNDEETVLGNNWFNICRYTVIYVRPEVHGPYLETDGKALITNEEIEQHYEVLERMNFDYNQPGSEYRIYPHPLPWADVSYGYTYPEMDGLIHNRYHSQADFPGPGEYALINYIKYDDWWRKFEQHGGKENGYMIYCDGMSSAGQVAALSLKTQLCEGQKMYFSAYVGNAVDIKDKKEKAKPNFTISVQGSEDGENWDDITEYMTGDIDTSSRWYQIFFPIVYDHGAKDYDHFRVRIFNMAASFDGNDFVLDDICLFATKPSLVAYQANTTCSEGSNDSIHHVVLRIDYQGIKNDVYNGQDVYYTIEKITSEKDTTFISLIDSYLDERTKPGAGGKPDTIYGIIEMPLAAFEPTHADSIYATAEDLILRFDTTFAKNPASAVQQGFVYEEEDEVIRPVMYVIHKAKVTLEDTYIVRMHSDFKELINSICAMTDTLKVSNHMMLELDGTEHREREVTGLCPNTSYDIGIRVKGSLYREGLSPTNIDGSCVSDWLLYGDTTDYSTTRYGYCFSDIVKVVTDVLRNESELNTNRFAKNLAAVSSSVMATMAAGVSLTTGDDAYTVLSNLVNNGFLTLYQSKITATLNAGDSVQYVAMPITGTGYDESLKSEVDVCPNPMLLKLKPKAGTVNLVIGGLNRDATQASAPVVVLANETNANMEIALKIDSLINNLTLAALDEISLTTTDDPEFRTGIHTLDLQPDRVFTIGGSNTDYYKTGDTILLSPAPSAYHMRAGYNYTFAITLQTKLGGKTDGGCAIGSVPFIVSVVPDHVRWNPQSPESNQWNNADNWLGIDEHNRPIHAEAHFAPLPTTSVIIPTLASGLPYPVLPDPSALSSKDSVKQVGFVYNSCADIRLMSGAALAQQQRLNYNNAVVDMSLPYNTWALRAAPVDGLLTGDIYMANADLSGATSPWEVGYFDASGRNKDTGNASIWMSVYSRSTTHKDNGVNNKDEDHECTDAEWSRTNSMTLSLPAAQGWAVYARTAAENNAAVRLPKNDDIYYYYDYEGNKMLNIYEQNLRSKRDEAAGGSGKAGQLAFHPDGSYQTYRLEKETVDTLYVFGNPTLGYIDIWGFISDNTALKAEMAYLNKLGTYVQTTRTEAEKTDDVITNQSRYLPPMHAMIVKVKVGSSTEDVKLYTNRIVTGTSQVEPPAPAPAPKRANGSQLSQGIMTVTAVNPVSSRCISYLKLGQGYHNAIVEGEDAVLTTLNIDKFTMTSTPTTPFNIYAMEQGYGMSIDLRDSLVMVPVSFYMSDLPFEPTTYLWFTGVNSIDGTLVLYDAQTDSERTIIDGICLDIETPESSHQNRYYICRKGYKPNTDENPITTDFEPADNSHNDEQAKKIIYNGHVLIIRNGHVYTMYGQKVQ